MSQLAGRLEAERATLSPEKRESFAEGVEMRMKKLSPAPLRPGDYLRQAPVQNVRLRSPRLQTGPEEVYLQWAEPLARDLGSSWFSTGWSCGLHADWTEPTQLCRGVLNKKENKQKNLR
ncbi:heparan-sulfate 6-O-sulfotransferase 1-A-like protein [Lates japonicus]|uniref:Heparan-sulfate 6-O-sulfotransferase 1-A-like protein n=1 Tax=Lates japonicus TaxID=270547 RepID=A0AAD3QX32_LATJO|nr:heparan-sulfate 6-O-sulfotransferase 1-A-like protein [Lates japonicus]